MNPGSPPLDVTRLIAILVERWKVIAACTAVVVGSAFMYTTQFADPVFEAQALITYQAPDRQSNPTGGALPSTGVTREDIGTLIGNAQNEGVLAAASKQAGTSVDNMRSSVAVRAHGDASIIDFVGRAGSGVAAAKLANAHADAFVASRSQAALKSIDGQIVGKQAEVARFGKIKVDDPNLALRVAIETELSRLRTQRGQWKDALSVSTRAAVPSAPVWPRTRLTLFSALVIGLGLGSGVALLTARVDRKLHGDEVDQLPAPVLVRVPHSSKAPKAMPLGPSLAEPLVADAFAALGARIMLDRPAEGALVVLVSSARSGEGKSTVAANLASALAQGGRRVVLVDADMRRPMQDTIFASLQGRPGLSQVLVGAADVEHSLTLVAPNLAAIPSGPRQANASVLLASVAFRQLVDRLSNISEVIVVDAPPALAVNDALAIAPAATQVLLCARVGISNLDEVWEANARVAAAASTPQALVLVGTERPTGYGYDHDLGGPARRAPGTSGHVAMPPARGVSPGVPGAAA